MSVMDATAQLDFSSLYSIKNFRSHGTPSFSLSIDASSRCLSPWRSVLSGRSHLGAAASAFFHFCYNYLLSSEKQQKRY